MMTEPKQDPRVEAIARAIYEYNDSPLPVEKTPWEEAPAQADYLRRAVRFALEALPPPPAEGPETEAQDEFDYMREAIRERVEDEGDGFWSSCSGCHETNEGYETGDYPYSKTFRCHPGSGCSECGGIGVIWNRMTEDDVKELVAISSAEVPNPSQDEDLDRLVELEKKATGGVWEVNPAHSGMVILAGDEAIEDRPVISGPGTHIKNRHNAAFIAAVKNAFPALVERVKRAERLAGNFGHNKPCCFCGNPCNGFAGNPGEWPSLTKHDTYAHLLCLGEQLAQLSALRSKLQVAVEVLEKVANVYMGDPPTPETQVNALVRCRHVARETLSKFGSV